MFNRLWTNLFLFKEKSENLLERYATSKYAVPLLAGMSFAESVIFPIPVDIFLIAMAYALPKRAIYFAFITTVFSVLGGLFGYALGYFIYESFLKNIILSYGYQEVFNYFSTIYNEYGIMAILIAGFTPIPYKIATIASGVFNLNIIIFIIFSFISRALRFFLVAYLIKRFHKQGKNIIDKYFHYIVVVITFIICILVILYFIYK